MVEKCGNVTARRYRQKIEKIHNDLNLKYPCHENYGKHCNLRKCRQYDQCRKEAKRKYKEWTSAFYNNAKEDMDYLFKGGL